MPTFTSTVTRSHDSRPTTGHNRKRRPGREFVAVKRDPISPQSFGEPFKDMLGDFTTKPLPKAPATEQVEVFMDQNRPAPPRPYASRKDLKDAGWEQVRESSKADHRQLKQAQSMPVLRSGQCQPVERSHARTKQAPNPFVLQNGFRHQISPFASPPVQEMNFKRRMDRRRLKEEQSWLRSDSDDTEETRQPRELEKRRKRQETVEERMRRKGYTEDQILDHFGYGLEQSEPEVRDDAQKYIYVDDKP